MKELISEFQTVLEYLWPTIKPPFLLMLGVAASTTLWKLVGHCMEAIQQKRWKKENEEWNKHNQMLRAQAKARQAAAEAQRQAALPWNRIKIQLHGTCPTCGQQTSWPYIGTCTCGTKIEEPKS